jgi:hypothetical protein
MAKLNHVPVQYPRVAQEYHVVSPVGKAVYITNDEELARRHPTVKAFGYRVIIVTTVQCELELLDSTVPASEHALAA